MKTDNTECWLSSVKFILQKLNIQHTGIKLNELVRSVRTKLCHSFLNYWNKKSKEPEGKKLILISKLKNVSLGKHIYLLTIFD